MVSQKCAFLLGHPVYIARHRGTFNVCLYVCVCSEEAEEGYGDCQATAWQKAQNTQDDILNVV